MMNQSPPSGVKPSLVGVTREERATCQDVAVPPETRMSYEAEQILNQALATNADEVLHKLQNTPIHELEITEEFALVVAILVKKLEFNWSEVPAKVLKKILQVIPPTKNWLFQEPPRVHKRRVSVHPQACIQIIIEILTGVPTSIIISETTHFPPIQLPVDLLRHRLICETICDDEGLLRNYLEAPFTKDTNLAATLIQDPCARRKASTIDAMKILMQARNYLVVEAILSKDAYLLNALKHNRELLADLEFLRAVEEYQRYATSIQDGINGQVRRSLELELE